MTFSKLTLILWWIEYAYKLEYLLLISGVMGFVSLPISIFSGIAYLFARSIVVWIIDREYNLTILKHILND